MESSNEKTSVPKTAANLSNLWLRILCYLAVLAFLVVALFPVPTNDSMKVNLALHENLWVYSGGIGRSPSA
jgi:hypothetical protein